MNKKYGFTLIELLGVIIILGIVLMVAVPAVSRYMKRGTNEYYHSLEKEIKTAGMDYLETYRSLLPRQINNVTVVSLEELVNNGYMEEVKDEDGNICTGQVAVKKVKTDSYEYYSCLVCGDEGKVYDSGSDLCSINESTNEYKDQDDYTINGVNDYYSTYQSTDFTLPTAKVWYKYGTDQQELVEDKLVGSPNKINTDKLGKTKVLYYYHGAKKEITVEVLDKTAPSKPEVVLKYDNASGKSYLGSQLGNFKWYRGSIYQEFKSTDYTKTGILGSGIKEYQLSSDGKNYTSLDSNHQITSETGHYQYQVKSVDNSGLSSDSTSYEFWVDNTEPECEIVVTSGTEGENGWYTSDVTVKLQNMKDPHSGIMMKSGDLTKEGQTKTINYNTTGVTIKAILTDYAGNIGTCSKTIKLDKKKPDQPVLAISDEIDSGYWHKDNFKITTSGASNISGNTYYYSIDNSSINTNSSNNIWSNNNNTITNNSKTADGNVYYFNVCSGAGLCSSNATYLVRLDKNDPTFTVAADDDIASGKWHKADFTVTSSIANNVSGNIYYHGLSNNPTSNQSSTPSSKIFNTTSATEDGTTYYFRVCSRAGRCATKQYIAKLDKVTPNAPDLRTDDQDLFENQNGNGQWHKANYVIAASGASNISGWTYYHWSNEDATQIKGHEVSVTENSATSSGITYYFKVCSVAGLCSTHSYYLARLDKEDPTFTVAATDDIASGNWHKADFTVTSSGASNVSGNIYYHGDANNPTTNSTSTSSSKTFNSNSSGTTYYFRVCSRAGKCITKQYVVKLDKTAPTIVANNSSNYITEATNVSITDYFTTTNSISGATTACKVGSTAKGNTNNLSLGVNTVTCTITGGSGLTASASTVFRHQYTATASCDPGYSLSGSTCSKQTGTNYSCPNGGTRNGTTCSKSRTEAATCTQYRCSLYPKCRIYDVKGYCKDSVGNKISQCYENDDPNPNTCNTNCSQACASSYSHSCEVIGYGEIKRSSKCGSAETVYGDECANANRKVCNNYSCSSGTLSGESCIIDESYAATATPVYDTKTANYSCPTTGVNGNTGAAISASPSNGTCSF